MKKHIRLFAMLIAIVLLLQCSALAANDAPVEALSSTVTFLSTSDSYEEMEGKADLVVFGTVVDQWTEVRGSSLVITVSKVAIDTKYLGTETATQIEIVQTGGINGAHSTGVPSNAPLLEDGDQYYLYLRFSPADEMYDAYYLILGGGQGNISKDEVNAARSNDAVSWTQLRERVSARFNRRGIIHTTNGPVYWPRAEEGNITVTYYIEETYTYDGYSISLPITFRTKIQNGFEIWNGKAKIAYQRNFSSGDITVASGHFGALDWEGRCDWCVDTDSGRLVFAYVYLNFTAHDMSDSLWDEIISHEAGHGLGLDHGPQNTLMYSQSGIYRAKTPQRADIIGLETAYGTLQ